MTKLAIVADIHIGNHNVFKGEYAAGLNARCRLALDVLQQAVVVAAEHECEAFIIAGDIFDTVRPSPQIIAATQDALTPDVLNGEQPEILLVVGNHDSASSAKGDHSLGPMLPIASVYESPAIIQYDDFELWLVPYQPGEAVDWFPKIVRALSRKSKVERRVLCFHLGIEDTNTESWMKGSRDSISLDLVEELMKKYGIIASFAGNWHDGKQWYVIDGKHDVVQCGTLIPTGFDNPGLEGYGNVVIFDTDAAPHVSLVEIPGPRFVKIEGPNAKGMIEVATEAGHTVFAKWTATLDTLGNAQETLQKWEEDEVVSGWQAVPDKEEIEDIAQEAAEAARSASTLEQATADYISKQKFEDGVDPKLVLETTKHYLNTAEE